MSVPREAIGIGPFRRTKTTASVRGSRPRPAGVLLRRALYDFKLVDRTVDGREYRRIDQTPPRELAALPELLNGGARSDPSPGL